MKNIIHLILIVCSYAGCPVNPVSADECRTNISEIAPGVYLRPGHSGVLFQDQALANIGFIAGKKCVAVIDSGGSATEGEALACAIRQVTGVPVCYLIISHHHPDHSLGSIAFKNNNANASTVEVIGHSKLERALALSGGFFLQRLSEQLGEELDASYIVVPDRTIEPETTLALDLGDRMLQIRAYPSAHTDNDLSVYDEQTGTLWLSDLLFVEHIPAIDASARGWLQVLDELSALPAQRVVPGHGPVVDDWPAAAAGVARYLSVLRNDVRALLDEGIDLKEAQEKAGYSEQENWQMFDEFHKRNVTKVYTEMEWED